jgi:hypothetical protein
MEDQMGKTTRAPSESAPPGRWLRSRTGRPCYIVYCAKRDPWGHKLYRLRFSYHGHLLTSSFQWTLTQLQEAGVRFLKRRPQDFALEVAP